MPYPKMISVKAAENLILKNVKVLGTETLLLQETLGRTLAIDLISPIDLPLFTNSAMDGFAVRAKDTIQATPAHPTELSVTETIPAGKEPTCSLKKGEAARVMTGGMMPQGADAVVPIEEVTDHGKNISIHKAVQKGAHLRKQGEIIRKGKHILRKGETISPITIGIAASLNTPHLTVFKMPRVGIFSTGNELIPLGKKLRPGTIIDSNRHLLRAALTQKHIPWDDLGTIPDQLSTTQQMLEDAATQYDVIITMGGVSMGAFDYVRSAIETIGQLWFWKIKMKPGKPMAAGIIGSTPIFSLPGNPVSAFLTFCLFVQPALKKMSGSTHPKRIWREATLSSLCRSDKTRTTFLGAQMRWQRNQQIITPLMSHGSHDLTAWQEANSILQLSPSTTLWTDLCR